MRKEVKAKRVLKFYFQADGLNSALDNLILKRATAYGKSGEEGAEAVLEIVEAKKSLAALWAYLDGVMRGFEEGEKRVLRFYGCAKKGALAPDCRREVKRVTVRFFRHATGLVRFSGALKLVDGYYCLLSERRG